MITDFLVDKAIDLLDTDKCEVGFPAVDFLTNYVSQFTNKEQLEQQVVERLCKITDIMFSRLAYPEWVEIDIDPDDDQMEYLTYRKLLKMMFLHLSMLKGYRDMLLTKLHDRILAFPAS